LVAELERPVAVVGMHAVRYPKLMRSVAEHIAAIGRLPLVHALTISGPPPAVNAASAVRAKDLLHRTALAPGVSSTGPVLLIDDTIRTRWTVTVAAALLADAGATSVLPPVRIITPYGSLTVDQILGRRGEMLGHDAQATVLGKPLPHRDPLRLFAELGALRESGAISAGEFEIHKSPIWRDV
jgi:hypothetical protein